MTELREPRRPGGARQPARAQFADDPCATRCLESTCRDDPVEEAAEGGEQQPLVTQALGAEGADQTEDVVDAQVVGEAFVRDLVGHEGVAVLADTGQPGIEFRASEAFIDEIPAAYKAIDVVMQDAADLVTVRHKLRQLVNVKGN